METKYVEVERETLFFAQTVKSHLKMAPKCHCIACLKVQVKRRYNGAQFGFRK